MVLCYGSRSRLIHIPKSGRGGVRIREAWGMRQGGMWERAELRMTEVFCLSPGCVVSGAGN